MILKLVCASTRKLINIVNYPTNKLDLSVSGPFKVISQKGKAWKLQELSTNKNYSVQPDYIVLRQSVVINEKPKLTKNDTSNQQESSDNDPITISRDKLIIHVNPHSSGENQPTHENTEHKTISEPPQVEYNLLELVKVKQT